MTFSCQIWLLNAQSTSLLPLDSILRAVEAKIPLHLAYSAHIIPKEQTFMLPALDQNNWKSKLKYLLKQADLDYRIMDRSVLIFPRKRHLCQGYIIDAETGEVLPGAHLSLPYRSSGVVSNNEGYYQMSLPVGKVKIEISYLGYESHYLELEMVKDVRYDIRLKPTLDLPEIIVSELDPGTNAQSDPADQENIAMRDLPILPGLGASMDVARYLSFLPGVSSGSDGFGGIHVRGGGADQNLFLLDDIPIYNPFHMLGASSIFNTDAIQSVDFSKGFFNPEHGGRLSSVLNVRMRDGHRNHSSIAAGISALSAHAVLEMPILKKKGTIMVAGQRSHAGSAIRAYSRKRKEDREIDGYFQPQFRDIYAKAFLDLDQSNKIIANFYAGGDNFTDTEAYDFAAEDTLFSLASRDQYKWGNLSGGIRWLHSFGNEIFAKTSAYFTTYDYESLNAVRWDRSLDPNSTERTTELTEFRSRITEKGMKSKFDIISGYKHQFALGFSFAHFDYTPGIVAYNGFGVISQKIFSEDQKIRSLSDHLFDDLNFHSQQWSIHMQDRWEVSDQWSIHSGLFGNLFTNHPAKYFSLQPRLNIRWTRKKSTLDLSLTSMQQPNHLISVSDNGFPNELWVPSTENVVPQKSWMGDFTWSYATGENATWRSSIYYKKMVNLISFRDDPSYLTFGALDNIDATRWEQDVVIGNGKSWGIENSWQIGMPKCQLSGTYTYARSTRQFDNKYLGFEFPYQFERPHEFAVHTQIKLNQDMLLSMSWQWGSGVGVPLAEGIYDIFGQDDFYVESIEVPSNDIELLTMPAYHRLDLSFVYRLIKPKYVHQLKVSLLNAYHAQNITFPKIFREAFGGSITFSSGLPFIPSLSYQISLP